MNLGGGLWNCMEKLYSKEYDKSYYTGPSEFKLVGWHFHHGSEHTIKGHRYDLEMHLVHKSVLPAGGYEIAVMGILFDTAQYTAVLKDEEKEVLDKFFSCMNWDNTKEDTTTEDVPFQDMLNIFDFENRYEYKGSLTTPPLSTNVHWNVLSTVYPISSEHYMQYLNQLGRNTKQVPLLNKTGTYRTI